MASSVKLDVEILNDIEIARLDDHTWRLYIELVLYAAAKDENGILPDADELVWYLRKKEGEFKRSMSLLIGFGLVSETARGYIIPQWQSFIASSDATSAERVRRYRERRKQNNGGVDDWAQVRLDVLARDANVCMYCNNEATHVDHIKPVSIGGTNELNNLVACCHSCNSSKRDRDMEEWFREQVFFSERALQHIAHVMRSE